MVIENRQTVQRFLTNTLKLISGERESLVECWSIVKELMVTARTMMTTTIVTRVIMLSIADDK